jgi:hypothetical protein
MDIDLTTLDARATLALAEDEVTARRRHGVARLELLLHWADLHTADPQTRPGAVPPSRGGDRLITLGSAGTPEVAELCWAELAIALHTGVIAVRNQAGRALDLRHRLPQLWAAVQALAVEPWVAEKVATMTSPLTVEQCALVDTAVTDAVLESPGRILAIAEAKTIEADLSGYRARLTEEARKTGVWTTRPRPGDLVDPDQGEPGTGRMTAKLPTAEILDAEANLADLTEVLEHHGDHDPDNPPTRDQLRAHAFALLVTDPHAAATLLDQLDTPPSAEPEPEADDDTPATPPRIKKRRPATVLVHLTDAVLGGHADGVARAEGIGPLLLEQVTELLQHRHVTVQPVIDLATIRSVNAYEHPTDVKTRTLLRTIYDVFPHSTSRATTRLDHDHAIPYDPGGPPGQTGDHNDAPVTRLHHRTKTHHPYQVQQIGYGTYRWTTPHGLTRIVTPHGTRKVHRLQPTDPTIVCRVEHDP